MRITKEANIRRDEILDMAEKMFLEKGFEQTSTNEIASAIHIAKGTLYYHFKTKNDMMNAIIERRIAYMISELNEIASKKEIPYTERILMVFKKAKFSDLNSEQSLEYIHSNENNLLHTLMEEAMIEAFTPILIQLCEEGIQEGTIHCPYLPQSVEMLLVYGSYIFDQKKLSKLSQKEILVNLQAFIYHIEFLLGTPTGTFSALQSVFC